MKVWICKSERPSYVFGTLEDEGKPIMCPACGGDVLLFAGYITGTVGVVDDWVRSASPVMGVAGEEDPEFDDFDYPWCDTEEQLIRLRGGPAITYGDTGINPGVRKPDTEETPYVRKSHEGKP